MRASSAQLVRAALGAATALATVTIVAGAEPSLGRGGMAESRVVPAESPDRASHLEPAPHRDGTFKVHGHWTIEVRDPDGSLAERREFENATTLAGRKALARFFRGAWATDGADVGTWSIGVPSAPLCSTQVTLPSGQQGCLVAEGSDLSIEAPLPGQTNAGKLFLRARFGATNGGNVSQVATFVTGALGRGNEVDTSFTSATLPQAISVQSGQRVNVNVAISF